MVISWLHSSSTSPVFGSTTSCAETRPRTSSSEIGISFTPAVSICLMDALVILRPSLTISSLPPPRMSRVALPPTSWSGLNTLARRLAVDEDRVLLVEVVEQVLGGHPEGAQQYRRVELAAAVDAHEQDVARVELEVDPRAAVRDDAGRVQQLAAGVRLALVVVEEDAGRAVQLADDDPLGAVDHEGAVGRHQRDLAEVDLLLLHVLDRARAGLRIDVPDHQLDGDLERRGEGHAALVALLHRVLRLAERVADELQRRGLVEVLDREDRLEHPLQAGIAALARRHAELQELVVRAPLDLDQVGDLDDLPDLAEIPPQADIVRYANTHSVVLAIAR